MQKDAGIAIGPILFVVAILAILATAIAAGSSTFATSSGQEANRTNAASMIQLGQNLKMGMDRIIALGTPVANVDINAANTTGNIAIFSPGGGGLIPPSTALSNSGSDAWVYTWATVSGTGTTARERIAILKVNLGTCNQINTQVGNSGTLTADLGTPIDNATNIDTWPTGLASKMVGCATTTNTTTTGNYFYQVLAVQ